MLWLLEAVLIVGLCFTMNTQPIDSISIQKPDQKSELVAGKKGLPGRRVGGGSRLYIG